MEVNLTKAQVQRLWELGYDPIQLGNGFADDAHRDAAFAEANLRLVEENRRRIASILEGPSRNQVRRLEAQLSDRLVSLGFQEVNTPHIIAYEALAKMGIGDGHPLKEKVFGVDEHRCLRPMLAPGLYSMMKLLRRAYRGPIRIFEVGPCYRRESRGNKHLEQFTMLNLVEMSPTTSPSARLEELIGDLMEMIGGPYDTAGEGSEVYGVTTDINVRDIEVASCAVGPHPLDKAHGIKEPWVGIGLGLERLILARGNDANIRRAGSSLVYLEGTRVDL